MQDASFISTRRFGACEASVVHAGEVDTEPDFGGRDVPERFGRMGLNWLCVRLADALVLIDPSSVTPEGGHLPAILGGPRIERALAALVVEPESVTHVFISHTDHVLGLVDLAGAPHVPRFSNAIHYLQEADWNQRQENRDGRTSEIMPFLEPVRQAGMLRLISGDHEPLDGVRLLHTGGESDGHQVVRIRSGDHVIFYLGDLVHFPIEVRHPDWAPIGWGIDHDSIAAARRPVFADAAAADATAVFTHSVFPGWGTIEAATAGEWSWRYTGSS